MYPELMVLPMREELTRLGVEELRSAAEVEQALAKPGTTMVVVNSICGCAAGRMRPAVRLALQHAVRPDQAVTVFAGQDRDATERAREYFEGYPPSSRSSRPVMRMRSTRPAQPESETTRLLPPPSTNRGRVRSPA